LWLRVPEAMRITLTGKLAKGVTAKDISLKILKDRTVEGGLYRSVEFAGDALGFLSLDERAVLPNMMAEFGAKNAYLPPDQLVFDTLEAKRSRDYTPIYPDDDAIYADEYALDVSSLQPQVAQPHNPDDVVDVGEVIGQPVQQAFIGTCTNGRLEDIAAAASVLKGQKVRCRMVVIPASSQVLLEATRAGYIETIIEAGATIATPGCGPCMGNHMGVPAPAEVTISSANRNFKGRMGTPEASIYLASPYVVAASAVAGVIADPREFLKD
jgi:homoaconitase/3-isopropylmalate dehydratase large subunit